MPLGKLGYTINDAALQDRYVSKAYLMDNYASLNIPTYLWAWGYTIDGAEGSIGFGNFTASWPKRIYHPAGRYSRFSTSNGHSRTGMAIDYSGKLWIWGRGSGGQIGNSINVNRQRTPVNPYDTINYKWIQAAHSYYTSAAIREDGTLWVWGLNGYGEAGVAGGAIRNTPNQIVYPAAYGWKKVACAYYHNVAVRHDGTLWTWGRGALSNETGCDLLGRATAGGNNYQPIQIGTASDWSDIACGEFHSLAIKANGTLWSWGAQRFSAYYTPSSSGSVLGRTAATAAIANVPTQIGTSTDWESIYGTIGGSYAINKNGQLYAWGLDRPGTLLGAANTSAPTLIESVSSTMGVFKKILCAPGQTIGIRHDGHTMIWSDGPGTQSVNGVQVGSWWEATPLSNGFAGKKTRKSTPSTIDGIIISGDIGIPDYNVVLLNRLDSII